MSEPTVDELAELALWIATRPPQVRAVMDRLPPACYVVSAKGLVCPAPGVTAVLQSYEEDAVTGRVTVRVSDGVIAAECDPDWLEVVDSEEQFAIYRAACEMIVL